MMFDDLAANDTRLSLTTNPPTPSGVTKRGVCLVCSPLLLSSPWTSNFLVLGVREGGVANLYRAPLRTKHAPRCLQDAFEMLPRSLQEASTAPQEASKSPSRGFQDPSRAFQTLTRLIFSQPSERFCTFSKMHLVGTKTLPRGFQEPPKRLLEPPRRP